MQEQTGQVSVIIVTVAKYGYIRECLNSIKGQSHPPREIIVIDNSLKEQSAEVVLSCCPQAKVYSSPTNLYYCQGLNQGIAMSSAEFLLCLNDDVTLDEDFIARALSGFRAGEKIGMVSGKILRPNKTVLDSTGLFLGFLRTAKERGYSCADKGQFDREGFVFGSCGAAFFLRRQMLEEIKEGRDYFDPDFHIFYEDLDVAWRANLGGWRAYYVPGALAYHQRGATVRQEKGIGSPYARRFLSDELHADLVKNRYLTIIKNETVFGFLLRLPANIIFEAAAWIYIILRRPRVAAIIFSQRNAFARAFKKRNMRKNAHNRKFFLNIAFLVGKNGTPPLSKHQKNLDNDSRL